MKKILFFVALIATIAFANKLQAQCIVSNLSIEVENFDPSSCSATFSLSWEQEVNTGNKFAYVHLWKSAAYHTPAANWANMYITPPASPKSADLVNSFATISIFDNGTPTPFIGTTYPPDNAVIPISSGLSVVKTAINATRERMTISNITLTISDCSGALPIKGDIWTSQSSNGSNAHCATQGVSFSLRDPILSGFKVCNPRTYNFGIVNNGTASVSVHYNLYKDDGDGIFEPGGDDGSPIFTSSPDQTIAPAGSVSGTNVSYPGSTAPGEHASLWIQVITAGASSTVIKFLGDPGCIPLPVSFKSFTATRNNENVILKWETASEQNNTGFNVERKAAKGGWENITFIASKAQNGNSSSLLSYAYTDYNNYKGISEYRIRQTDKDGLFKYSADRMVSGLDKSGKTIIYPNPSRDGKINVLFNESNVIRDISLFDMNGKTIKQWQGVSDNNLMIQINTPGFYNLKIVIRDSGEQTVEKILVTNR
jgi:Secretion system C-terminal sorting domain